MEVAEVRGRSRSGRFGCRDFLACSNLTRALVLASLLGTAGCQRSSESDSADAIGGAGREGAVPAAQPVAGTVPPGTVSATGQPAPDPEPPVVPEWRISDTPIRSIGAEASGPTSDMFRVRPVLLSDGSLVVGDGRPRLMFFDPSWNYIKSVGRRGQGPGEFVDMARIQRIRGDSLVVLDTFGGDGRTSIFTRDGEFVRFVNTGAIPRPIFNAMLEDGTFLSARNSPYPAASVGELARTTITLQLHDRDGRLIRSLGEIPGTEVLTTPGLLISGYGLMVTSIRAHGRSIYTITGDSYEIGVFDVDRGHVGTITYPHRPIPYPAAAVVEAFAGTARAGVVTRANLRRWPEDKVYPAVSNVTTDEDGHIWVEEYGPADQPKVWRVFSSTGEVVATVMMPFRFVPHQILRDRILGVHRDEFNVERVQLRSLTRTVE